MPNHTMSTMNNFNATPLALADMEQEDFTMAASEQMNAADEDVPMEDADDVQRENATDYYSDDDMSSYGSASGSQYSVDVFEALERALAGK